MNELKQSEKVTFERSVEIHPLASVDSRAELSQGVIVGAGAVIGPEVQIGSNTIVGPNAVLEGKLKIGASNKIFPGACLGLEPQDLKYKGAPTEVVIGDRNTFRECVTINRATNEGEQTKIGDGSLLMAYTHVGHNCKIGDGVVISNSVQVAGHVVIEDKAVIGGCLGIHQFVHVGFLAMVGGMTRVDRDVPPYCLAEGHPGRLRGLNRVGIRRSGLESHNQKEFQQLMELWNLFFRSEYVYTRGLELAKEKEKKLMPAAQKLFSFVESSIQKGRRGPMPSLMNNK